MTRDAPIRPESSPVSMSAGGLPGDREHVGREHVAREPEHQVLQAIRETTFGIVEVTVHQSRIVQITRSEKMRF